MQAAPALLMTHLQRLEACHSSISFLLDSCQVRLKAVKLLVQTVLACIALQGVFC